MYLKQLSVFLENKPGTLEQALRTLKDNNINIVALSLADTSEFGLLRLIVDKPDEGKKALKEKGCTSIINDVLMIRLKQRVGFLQELMEVICKDGINVEYMYAASSESDSAEMIIKTSDLSATVEALSKTDASVLDGRKIQA